MFGFRTIFDIYLIVDFRCSVILRILRIMEINALLVDFIFFNNVVPYSRIAM